MKKCVETIRAVPWWGWAAGLGYFALQYGLYRLGEYLSRVLGTVAYAFVPKLAAIDDRIPVVSVAVVIYVFSYAFWICGPIAVSLTKRRHFVNYLAGLSLAYLIGFLMFIFLPTYMDRAAEGLMTLGDRPGLFDRFLGTIYAADGGSLAYNLFPSYHCLISTYCYLGVRKQPEISRGFRIYSLAMALLIVASTLLTKQHYILDCICGAAISVGCYALAERIDPGARWEQARAAAGETGD